MLLDMVLILMIASAFIEIAFVRGSKSFKHVMHDGLGPIPGIWCNLVFSVGLSWGLGTIFGAEGLIAFMGGIASTVVTAMYYPQMDRLDVLWAQREEFFSRFKQVALVTWKTVVLFWSILTAPVRFAMWITPRAKAGYASALSLYDSIPFTHRKAVS